MSSAVTNHALLTALQESGYFSSASFDPSAFVSVAERKLNVSWQYAVDQLVKDGLATLQYTEDPNIHLKDRLDYWRINLTEAGREILAKRSNP